MSWCSSMAIVLSVCAVGVLQSEAVGNDLEKLQGKWVMVSHVADGELDDALAGAVRVVDGGEFVIRRDDKILRAARIELDANTQPKCIDITFTQGPESGKVRKGIYVLVGDTHQICYGELNEKRPEQFVSKPGSGHRLVVFERIGTTVRKDGREDHHDGEIGEVIFENNYAKVLRVQLEPGQSQPRHYGGYRLVYSLNDYVITWSEDRKLQGKKTWKEGQIHFHRPGEHSVKNSGAEAAKWLVFAPKALPRVGKKRSGSDLLEVAPKHARELFDNEYFKVRRVKLGPGESIARHTGSPRLIYSLSDYTIRYGDIGESHEKSFKKGDCHWHEAGPHELENVGSGTVEFLVFHSKAAN